MPSDIDDLRDELRLKQFRLTNYKANPDGCTKDELIDAMLAVDEAERAINDEEARQAKTMESDALVVWIKQPGGYTIRVISKSSGAVATATSDYGARRQFVLADDRFVEVPSGEVCGPH